MIGNDGQMVERSITTDCKSVGFGLRGFDSLSAHQSSLKILVDSYFSQDVVDHKSLMIYYINMSINKEKLFKYYFKEKKSISEIAGILGKSENGINYWMNKFGFKKRSIGEAIYLKNNPKGDPFKVMEPNNLYLAELRGFGLGLYWGEGNKKNKNSIRLANTDPALIGKFIEFLVKILGIKKEDVKFSLQIFSDISPIEAKKYWIKQLKIKDYQFYSGITITKSGKIGNYKNKSKYGVLTIYYHNTKLRNILIDMLPL